MVSPLGSCVLAEIFPKPTGNTLRKGGGGTSVVPQNIRGWLGRTLGSQSPKPSLEDAKRSAVYPTRLALAYVSHGTFAAARRVSE